jgi:hypothetical protein
MILVGESSAIMPTLWTKDDEGRRLARHWCPISMGHIVQIGDIDEPVDGKRRKRE